MAAIKREGGIVWYEWEWKGDRPIAGAVPSLPNWLLNRVGVDCIYTVVGISSPHLVFPERPDSVDRPCVSDLGMSHAAVLTDLRYLDLKQSRVSTAGLVHLTKLRGLKYLDLSETWVGDDGLAHIGAPRVSRN